MKHVLAILSVFLLSGILAAQDVGKPFVDYPETIGAYLKRIQQGDQAHAFDPANDFAQWQVRARKALVELTGLRKMGEDLAGFQPKVRMGEPENVGGKFSRTLCSIETEPGITLPFYLLIPLSVKENPRLPLIICPHGHDTKGLHSYAGAFKDEKHRKQILARQGNIAEQAALRGYVAIAPATRGLAKEVLVPDPNGRHGNRP